MTLPRRVLPDTSYHLTRRCAGRRFYLRPGPKVRDIFLYALAAAQLEYDVGIHAFIGMSNHLHIDLTDKHGNLSDFLGKLHREISLPTKALYDIDENLWNLSKSSAVELSREDDEDDKSVIDQKIVYTILNAVRAGLVEHASEWPGAISLPGVSEYRVKQPDLWFAKTRPEELTLHVTPPPHREHDPEAWHASLAEQVAAGEAAIAAERARDGKGRVLGVKRVLAQRPQDRPRNADRVRPSRTPVLATGNPVLMMIAIKQLREWRRAYYEARERWITDKTTVFPPGTWWVVKRAGAAVAAVT